MYSINELNKLSINKYIGTDFAKFCKDVPLNWLRESVKIRRYTSPGYDRISKAILDTREAEQNVSLTKAGLVLTGLGIIAGIIVTVMSKISIG